MPKGKIISSIIGFIAGILGRKGLNQRPAGREIARKIIEGTFPGGNLNPQVAIRVRSREELWTLSSRKKNLDL